MNTLATRHRTNSLIVQCPVDTNEHGQAYVQHKTKLTKLPPLRLSRRNAIHVTETLVVASRSKVSTPSPSPSPSRYIPDYHLTVQFLKFPLMRYSRSVTNGFLRQTDGTLSIPSELANVCKSYFVHSEDELFQIAYKLFLVLSAIKKPSVPAKVVFIVMADYLKHKDMATLKRYLAELERLQYIENVHQCYGIPMAAKMLFMNIRSRRT